MKIIVLISTAILLLSAMPVAPETETTNQYFRIPDFRVISTETDPALDQNHALFEIHFSFLNKSEYKAMRPPFMELSCNGVIRTFELDSTNSYSVEVTPGTYTFVLSAGNRYYEVFGYPVSIEGGMKSTVQCSFRPIEEPTRVISYKPVIYTYSEQSKALSLVLDPVGTFTFTYPEYNEKWSGTANPDGSFTTNGKNYPYLFWEGNSDHLADLQDFSEGFIVEKENVIDFLEKQLTEIGFNYKERTDFITFWGPRMTQSEKGIARFLVNDDYNKLVADLNVSPKPDHLYRLYLLWTPLNGNYEMEIKPQQLPKLERGGLTIIEWGGSEIPMEENL